MGEGKKNKKVWPLKRRMKLKGSGIEETEAQQNTVNLHFCESCNCEQKLYFYVVLSPEKEVYSEI
jgi:hypothetical protein